MTWHKKIWNKRLLLWWYRLWIRKDEFHKSLDIDPDAMMEMDEEEKERYLADLVRRRKKAHQKDLARFKEDNPSFPLNSFEDDAEKIKALDEKLEEGILQVLGEAGLNITKEHFRTIMRIWGPEEIRAMMRIEAKDPYRKEGLYRFISPGARKWNRDLVTAILDKFVSTKEYQNREKQMDKIIAEG